MKTTTKARKTMSEHTPQTTIDNLRETVERQAAELAELRAMIAPFGDGLTEARWMDKFDAMTACREYNRKRKVTDNG
jgi:hypothetical protein